MAASWELYSYRIKWTKLYQAVQAAFLAGAFKRKIKDLICMYIGNLNMWLILPRQSCPPETWQLEYGQKHACNAYTAKQVAPVQVVL